MKNKDKPEKTPVKTEREQPANAAQTPQKGETGGPTGPEPTRYGDWERKGRVSDF